jgi:hypothetical protein
LERGDSHRRALANLSTLKRRHAFLTQLQDDLSTLFYAQKTAQGGHAQIIPPD